MFSEFSFRFRSSACTAACRPRSIPSTTFAPSTDTWRSPTRAPCATCSGPIPTNARGMQQHSLFFLKRANLIPTVYPDGAFLLAARDTRLARTFLPHSTTTTASLSLHEHINWSWTATTGATSATLSLYALSFRRVLLKEIWYPACRSSVHQTIATDAATRPRSWRLTSS